LANSFLLSVGFWPIAEIVDAEIQAHLSSAHKRTAELSLVRVILAAFDPKPNFAPTTLVSPESANSSPSIIKFIQPHRLIGTLRLPRLAGVYAVTSI